MNEVNGTRKETNGSEAVGAEASGARGEGEQQVDLGPLCPGCGEPWLRPTQLPGSYRCVYCLVRYQLVSHCPSCGEHSTIVRMRDTAMLDCVRCGASMLKPV